MRIGAHEDYTRLVFEFPKLTAYAADRGARGIVLTFETGGRILQPAAHYGLIRHMRLAHETSDSLQFDVDLQPGATFKDYRLNNKIVVDIYPPAAAKPPETIAAKPPETIAAKPPEPKIAASPQHNRREHHTETAAAAPAAAPSPAPAPAPPPAAAPAPVPAPTPAAETPPLPVPARPQNAQIQIDRLPPEPPPEPVVHQGPSVPPAPVKEVAAEPLPDQPPTRITVSTVEPVRLAVFSRFDILWIVMDSETAGAIPPEVSGPEAGVLGPGKLLRFKGGAAYRYTLAPKRYLNVEKRNLSWIVSVSTAQKQTPGNAQVNVDFDEVSKRAKLVAQLNDAANPLKIDDPAAGDTLYAVPTEQPADRIDQGRRFPDVEIIPAATGMAIRPIADDIAVKRIENVVFVTSPEGIIATAGAGPRIIPDKDASAADNRLFDFPAWRQGGLTRLYRNRRQLEDKIAAATRSEEKQDLLMRLALLYFANHFGQETLGVLRLIEEENPDIAKIPRYLALRGAAAAMAGHYDDALKDLSNPLLQRLAEVKLWIGYAAAASEQWHMANRYFPPGNRLLLQYPENISVPFTIYMAESALRLGHNDSANVLLGSLAGMSDNFDLHDQAAAQYLKGEAARQAGNDAEAIRLWEPVAFGIDRLYHTKASLALANLRLEDKQITLKQAIDTVDSLRFAWRGDGLEVQILHNLGLLKIRDKQYLSGLEDLKTAAALADGLQDDSQPLRDDMRRAFIDLFVGGAVKDIPPLESVSIYNEFNSFLPPGADGSAAVLNFADSLITIDLLDKAESLLETQLRQGQLGPAREKEVRAKLAAVYLLDNLPDRALAALQPADAGACPEACQLLKARALSQLNRTDEAIALLTSLNSRESRRLKADVLWHARRWDQAAAAIEALLPQDDKPLSDDDAALVVNAAVAYKLAGDQKGLADVKTRFGALMAATPLTSTFGVVTRLSAGASLADRDTIMKMADEVDMFKGFLDTYKSGKGS
jgi:hypothetical protein